MKYVLLICLSLLFISDERPLIWSDAYRLEWSDFKANPKSRSTVVAVTASGITFSYTTKKSNSGLIDYNFQVEAHFYPEQSWYVKDRVNRIHLSHERLHFDITELYARKFRKEISNTKFTNHVNREMDAIYQEITDGLRNMQNLYDEESSHSINVGNQKKWEKYIALELEKLVHYR